MEKFSVLMSVYKGDSEIFLRRALESISVDQILKPTQIVLVVDGPVSDKILDIIMQFEKIVSDSIEFTLIKKEKNAGLAAALNTGLSACHYDLVARMDSDDIALPHRFSCQVDYMENHPETAVLGGNITEFEEDENIIVDRREVPAEHLDIIKMLKTRNPVNHTTVMYRKDIIEKVGGYCENFGKLEDYKLWVDVVVNGYKIHNLQDNLVNVRVGNGFIERRSNKREIEDWDMLQKYLLSTNMITKRKAFKNKLYIRAFIYMPKWMKKIAYKTVLRKK